MGWMRFLGLVPPVIAEAEAAVVAAEEVVGSCSVILWTNKAADAAEEAVVAGMVVGMARYASSDADANSPRGVNLARF